jgi:Zn-finger nucleic acid-binding protein
VPLQRIRCPECGAGLKSSAGFTVGKTITCPKCESDFVVEEPEEEKPVAERRTTRMKPATKKLKVAVAEDEEDEDREDEDRPKKAKKKKKKKRPAADEDEEEWSYKNSWIRYAVLGVLLLVLAVLSYMLYEKRKKEANAGLPPPPNLQSAGLSNYTNLHYQYRPRV